MKRLFGLLAAVAVTACSTNEVEEAMHPMSGEPVVVSASIDGASSRVAMEEIADPAGNYIKVDWKNGGESFIVIGSNGMATFEQTASTEDSPSLFAGTLPGEGTYQAVYPADVITWNPAAILAHYANQQGTLDESLCVMMDLESDGSAFNFRHQTSILRPTFKVGDTELANNTITSVIVSSPTISFISDNFGMEDTPLYVKAVCDQLDVIYLYLVAQIEEGDADRSFDVVVTTSDAKIYTGQLRVPDGKTLLPGKFYTPTITLTEPTEQLYTSATVATPDEEMLGEGTAENPYKIFRAGDLAWLLGQEGSNSYGKYYDLESDFKIESDSEHPWSFCDPQNPFMGVLDGQGHTISGDLVAAAYDFFFGFVGMNQGMIENLTIDANVVGSNMLYDVGPMLSGNPDVHLYLNGVGAVAGANMGTIDNCTNSGTVSGGTVTSAEEGSMMGAGGLVGFAITGSITNSSNSGDVTGTSTTNGVTDAWNGAGGITGGVTGASIDQCSNTGTITGGQVVDGKSIAGGIAGYGTNMMGDVIITNCTNDGAVNGTSSDDDATDEVNAGGIIGFVTDSQPQSGNDGASKIANCTNNGPVSSGNAHGGGDSFVGGIAGSDFAVDIIDCTNTASATIRINDLEIGNLDGAWSYGGGIVGYLSSHDSDSSVTTSVSGCKNLAAVIGPLVGDYVLIGGIVGRSISGHILITECENHGAIDGRGSEHTSYLNTGGIAGGTVDYTEIFKCINYGTVNGGTANQTLYTGGIVGDLSGVDESLPEYSCVYDTVNEASGIVTCGTSTTATLENPKAYYGGIAGVVSNVDRNYYDYPAIVCTCCVDKSNCAGGLIGHGNKTPEPHNGCTSESH